MILKALADYYERMQNDPDTDIAPPGFEKKAIPFLIVINTQGHLCPTGMASRRYIQLVGDETGSAAKKGSVRNGSLSSTVVPNLKPQERNDFWWLNQRRSHDAVAGGDGGGSNSIAPERTVAGQG